MSIFERFFVKSSSRNTTPVRKRQLRLETLESRELLSVNPALVQEVQAAHADLNLAGDYNVIEITAAELSDGKLRDAIASAGTTPENDLIVLRTTETQNKITLNGEELAIDFDPSQYGSVTIVGLGTNSLTLDANQQSRIFYINYNAEAGLAGLTITNGYASSSGGGIYIYGGTLTITNSTITENSAEGNGGGIYNENGAVTLYNTIVAENSTDIDKYFSSGTIQGFNNLTSFTDWTGTSGDNLVYDSSYPLFVDENNGDYRLAAGSQAIDAGNNSYVPSGLTKDLAGNARIQGSAVDIGAYELQIPATPTALKTDEVTDTTVVLSWLAPADSVVTGYELLIKAGEQVVTNADVKITGVTATVSGLLPETTYSFQVIAKNTTGSSDPSDPVTATTQIAKPDAPTVTTSLENGKPKLTWNAVSGAVTYRVYRLNDTGTGWENVSGNALKATTFTDATAPAGVHTYAVRAFLSGGAIGSVFDNTKYVTVTAV